jgi:hypothetical protein
MNNYPRPGSNYPKKQMNYFFLERKRCFSKLTPSYAQNNTLPMQRYVSWRMKWISWLHDHMDKNQRTNLFQTNFTSYPQLLREKGTILLFLYESISKPESGELFIYQSGLWAFKGTFSSALNVPVYLAEKFSEINEMPGDDSILFWKKQSFQVKNSIAGDFSRYISIVI